MATSTHLRALLTSPTLAAKTLSRQSTSVILDPYFAQADRLFTYALYAHSVIAFVLMFAYQTWFVTFCVSAAALIVFHLARVLAPASKASRWCFGIAIQAFVSLHIYQLNGMAETHFFFFTAIVVMVAGYDWLAMWPGATLMLAQHLVFAYFANSDTPTNVFARHRVTAFELLIYCGIAIVHVVLCGAWAAYLRRHVLADAAQKIQLLRSEKAVRISEEKLRNLTDALPGAVFQCHSRLDGKRVFTYFSRGVQELFGTNSDSQALDESIFAKIHQNDRARLQKGLSDNATAGERWSAEFQGADAVGPSWYRVHAIAQPHPAGGTIWTGALFDISQQKEAAVEREKLEQKIREAQRLESLGVMAGGIAHDFNNLLTVMLGNTALARAELPDGSNLDQYLRPVEQSGTHAADLCQQMLAYAGKGRFVVTPIDLTQIVKGTAELLTHVVANKGELLLELDHEIASIVGDESQMRQVVVNLVQNAAESLGPSGGKVIVRTGWDGHRTNINLSWLEVADTGCGMSSEVVEKIFDPFFSTKFVGRGLGLSVVHGIVRGHKGEIRVESRLGVGTRIRILFPADSTRPPPKRILPTPALQVIPPRAAATDWVLVIDDEASLRTVVSRMVQTLNYRPVQAEDAVSGLHQLASHATPPLAILLDLTMPGTDGYAARKLLKREAPNVPVILMSGYSEHVLSQKYQGDGFAGFLQKPFNMMTLREKITECASAKGVLEESDSEIHYEQFGHA